MIYDNYIKIIDSEGEDAAIKYLINAQDEPQHVKSLLRWARRYIECGHVVTAGYTLIGPTLKRAKGERTAEGDIIVGATSRVRLSKYSYTIYLSRSKIGTHSGYYGYYKKQTIDGVDYYGLSKHDKIYHGWDVEVPETGWSMKEFSAAAVWLMMKQYSKMRELNFQFNSLCLHTNNMCVLDLDIYKSKLPKQTLDWIISKIPTGTPCSLSQAGGKHYYFKPIAGVQGKPELGIDVLQGNHFVFAPPTRVKGGGVYGFENIKAPEDFPRELPELPSYLIGFFMPPEPIKSDKKVYKRDDKLTEKQLEILEKRFADAEANEGNDDGGRSLRDYAAVHWAQTIGMSMDDFWVYAQTRSKFLDRGIKYCETIWRKCGG